MTAPPLPAQPTVASLRFLWAELTTRCGLRCIHCYASAGPDGNDGTMSVADWKATFNQAARLGARTISMIGGEPTLYQGLEDLIRHALGLGL
ncbi:radical SAM protein [Sinosporangium siamense]